MRQIAHFAQPPPPTSNISAHDPTRPAPATLTSRLHVAPFIPQPGSRPNRSTLIDQYAHQPHQGSYPGDPTLPSRLLLRTTQLPQPGIHPLPRTPSLSAHRSRRNRLLNHNDRHLPLRNHDPRSLRQNPHRRRHPPLVHPIRTSRRRHEHRLQHRPPPIPEHHPGDPRPLLEPPYLPRQQPTGKNRRRQQRPEENCGTAAGLRTSPPGHRQTVSTHDEAESDHLSCLYRSSEHR